MYFTSTPALNSMETIMQRPPGGNQRGGGRLRRVYPFSKADCDCRLCLYHRKKKGCSMEVCPVLDVRLSCGAASLYEAVHAAFADARHIPFQRRLSHLYDRKDDAPLIFQSDQHRQRFEAQKLYDTTELARSCVQLTLFDRLDSQEILNERILYHEI